MNHLQSWAVHKFGGTSVGNAERYLGVSKILETELKQKPELQLAVVVSAMKGVTDGLIKAVNLARTQDDVYLSLLKQLKQRHLDATLALQIESDLNPILENDFKDITEVLRGIWLTQTASERNVEFISGFGEIWSAQILSAYLKKNGKEAQYLDARKVLTITPLEKGVAIDWENSKQKLTAWFQSHSISSHSILVITGFVASTLDGIATTLKRNGSDFSGSIFGALLHAKEISIWTDVDGVLSADPRLVPDAIVLNEMTYHEVTELANFGAKVIHPATMEPAIRLGIPVYIRNTFNPTFPGTKIHAHATSETTVKGISAIEKMALINLEGNGMVGVTGVAERLFSALRLAEVSAVMISQASSEHSICIAVPEDQAFIAKAGIEKAFFAEIHQGILDKVEVTLGMSILAAVGDNMVKQPGVAGQFFSALGKAGVNIHAIAQGSSERNISAVIEGSMTSLALRAVHSSFYLSPQTIGIGVIGNGLIGKEFIKQLRAQIPELKKNHGIDLRLRAISNSKTMLLDGNDERGIDLTQDDLLSQGTEILDLEKLLTHFKKSHLPHSVIIDATASNDIPKLYPHWLKNGLHIITPNKKANSGTTAFYQTLRDEAQLAHRHFLYSTNVCAGLPVLQTLKELKQTGDEPVLIEGILSGTLSYLFNRYDGTRPFSEVVLEAKKLGFTEPDPREDLSGLDFARKLVILAREAGMKIELDQVPIENLVPEALRTLSLTDYLSRITEGDSEMLTRFQNAQSQGKILRYAGSIDPTNGIKVSLAAFPKDHAFSGLKDADNLVSFKTKRYHTRPLIIQGPGAGPEVTAGGMFADLLRLAARLGSRS